MFAGEFFLLPPCRLEAAVEEDEEEGALGGREAEADREDGDCRFKKDLRLFIWGWMA